MSIENLKDFETLSKKSKLKPDELKIKRIEFLKEELLKVGILNVNKIKDVFGLSKTHTQRLIKEAEEGVDVISLRQHELRIEKTLNYIETKLLSLEEKEISDNPILADKQKRLNLTIYKDILNLIDKKTEFLERFFRKPVNSALLETANSQYNQFNFNFEIPQKILGELFKKLENEKDKNKKKEIEKIIVKTREIMLDVPSIEKKEQN